MTHHSKSANLRLTVLLASTIFFAAGPRLAHGHAILVSSQPAAKAVVHGTSTSIVLRYNSRIDAERSSLILVGPDGKGHTLAVDPRAPANILQSSVSNLADGSYTVRWQVLASDGHITRGTFSFAVR